MLTGRSLQLRRLRGIPKMRSHARETRLALLMTNLLLWRRSQALIDERSKCYFPDGTISLDGFACNLTAVENGENSSCCRLLDTCLTSGTCLQTYSGWFYRFGCTDPTYRDQTCSRICTSGGAGTCKLPVHDNNWSNHQLIKIRR